MMRKKPLLLLSLLTFHAYAQDVIVKRDGSIIQSKVLEVNESDIKYKKHSNPSGPTYTIGLNAVLAVNYENGDKDTFEELAATPHGTQEAGHPNGVHLVQPDSHNAELIAHYNRFIPLNKKQGSRRAMRGVAFLGVDEESVLSCEDMEINLVQEPYMKGPYWSCKRFVIQIRNKQDTPLYIDLGNTFRVFSDGQAHIYYDGSQTTTVTHGSHSGSTFGIGAIAGAFGIGGALGTLASGVSVGGGTSGTSSKTYTRQRVLTVPPHGKVALEEYQQVEVKSNQFETISHAEIMEHTFAKAKSPDVPVGGTLQYGMASSPHTAQYTITYSHHEDFSDVNVVKVNTFMRELWGNNQYVPSRCPTEKSMRKKLDKMVPGHDNYTIVGRWWMAR